MIKYILTALFLIPSALFAGIEDDILYPSVEIRGALGAGSGFVVKTDPAIGSFIMTNHHVATMEKEVTVKFFGDDEQYPAYVYAYNREYDMAIMVSPHKSDYVVKLGSTYETTLFRDVICIGNSLGLGTVPSKGIITEVEGELPGRLNLFLRTDCKIAPGNSGGGVFTKKGDSWVYIGMPSAVLILPRNITSQIIPHLGFAVSIKDIKTFLHYYRVINVKEAYDVGRPY